MAESMTADAEGIAREFHAAYESLAPDFGYRTRDTSAVPWEDVPSGNKRLMVATVTRLLERGAICGPAGPGFRVSRAALAPWGQVNLTPWPEKDDTDG